MKSYHDIAGDGGSDVIGQVVAKRSKIAESLSQVRHMVAIGSGKGGVGKSTLTMQLGEALRAGGSRAGSWVDPRVTTMARGAASAQLPTPDRKLFYKEACIYFLL